MVRRQLIEAAATWTRAEPGGSRMCGGEARELRAAVAGFMLPSLECARTGTPVSAGFL